MKPSFLRLLMGLVCFPLAAHGTIVDTLLDKDDGSLKGGSGISLREAVKYAAVGDTITFAPTLSGQTIRLTAGQITIASKILTIDSSSLSVPITISGDKTGDGSTADDTTVFVINNGPIVLKSLVISGAKGGDYGGGIYCSTSGVAVTVRNCTFSGNYASTAGGGIYSVGPLTIENSTFTGNSARSGGGALLVSGPSVIENSTFSGNSSATGGAIRISGAVCTL